MYIEESRHEKMRTAGTYLARAASFVLLLLSLNAFAQNNETLATLQVGERTYQGVTVSTKGKDYILIVHSSGITSLKVTQLPNELREKLGYASKPHTSPVLTAKKAVNRGMAWVEVTKAEILQAWEGTGLEAKFEALGTYWTVFAFAAVLLLAHVFCSYCCMLICQKTGADPGVLVWFPVLQAVPMLRAASMSLWWFGALFIPGLNLFAWGLWCVKIVAAREKTLPLAILLMFPLTTWFAFPFLAFSEDSREKWAKVRVTTMAFQSVCGSKDSLGVPALLQREQRIVG